jgi:hypothetical protein
MPIHYECDHGRRLITATYTEPHTVDEVLDVIERQMVDNAWEYATLHDMRTTTHLSTLDEARQITARVQALSGGRTRGPVGMAISRTPEQLREGLRFAEATKHIGTLEVLLTKAQLEEWLGRHVERRSTMQR